MITQIKTMFFYLLIAIPQITLCLCPEIEVWTNGINYRYLVKDWHVDFRDGALTIKQQRDLVWAAMTKKNEGVCVLVEDPALYLGNDKKLQEYYKKYGPKNILQDIECKQIKEKESVPGTLSIAPILCLSLMCQNNNIPYYNTECGQALFCNTLTPQEILATLDPVISNIEKNNYLKLQAAVARKKLIELESKQKNLHSFMDHFVNLRDNLVNLNTVHKLTQLSNVKHVFVCEGGWHIESIKKDMTQMGYRCEARIGNAAVWEIPDKDENSYQASQQVIHNALDLQETFSSIFGAVTLMDFSKNKKISNPLQPNEQKTENLKKRFIQKDFEDNQGSSKKQKK
jgi:hypothetical protein